MTKHSYLWFDLETTGVDEREGRPLEFAALLAADAPGDDFREIRSYAGAIHWPAAELAGLQKHKQIDDYVYQMHLANGLWADVEASQTSVVDVDQFLDELATELLGGAKKTGIILAGSSVHFDYRWCRAWFPRFFRRLSHRLFDVRTLMTAVDVYGWTSLTSAQWAPRETHRALPDIRATLADARTALGRLR